MGRPVEHRAEQGPVTSWGKVATAINQPAAAVEPERSRVTRTSARAKPSLTSRASDAVRTKRGSNVLKR